MGGGSEAGQYARQYGNTAASLYSNVNTAGQSLNTQGNTLYNQASGQLGPLIQQFMGSAGLGGTNGQPGGQTGLSGQPGANTGPSSSTQATAQSQFDKLNGQTSGGQLPQGGASAPIPQNLAAHAAQNPGFDPYQLDSNQQAYLSSQLDSMNQQTQAAIQQFHSTLAALGINDSEAGAAGEAYLQQQSQLQQNSFVTSFMEQQRANKEQALASLITLATQQQGLGLQTESAGTAEQAGAAGGYAGLAGQNAQQSAQQAQQSGNLAAGAGSLITSLLPTSWFTAPSGSGSGGGTTPFV